MQWTHLLTALPLVALVCGPACENEAFVLFAQAGLVPALVLTGVTICQQARLGRLISGARRWPRHGTANDPG